jgi:hypothetical protein
LIRIDGQTFQFLGAPLEENPHGDSSARQVAFHYTSTRSIFAFEAGGVRFNATFLSPVTPHDFVRQSLPFSYLFVDFDVESIGNKTISVYTDISGEWASGDSNVDIEWEYTSRSGVGAHSIYRKVPLLFSEVAEQAEWGRAVYATSLVRFPLVFTLLPSRLIDCHFFRRTALSPELGRPQSSAIPSSVTATSTVSSTSTTVESAKDRCSVSPRL